MVNIKRLLSKSGWTGRELGILELTNMCVIFRQALEGKDPKPLVEQAQFSRMLNTITDKTEGQIYNDYVRVHEWLNIRYNIAHTQLQQAQLQYTTLANFVTDATLAEDVYRYIEQLPAIMTQKQYDEIRAERIKAWTEEAEGLDTFSLVEHVIAYYSNLLISEPGKANPLKAIRKKYINKPVKSKFILSHWNEVQGEGYYTIEDGSGRRSDTMTNEDWQEAVSTPAMKEALAAMHAPDGSGEDYTRNLSAQRLIARSKVIYEGGTEQDADRAQEKADYERGLATPVKWHYYEEPPADLTKWDIIEQGAIQDLYFTDLNGGEQDRQAAIEDFATEFSELVSVVLKDIDKKLYKGEPHAAQLPIEEWATTLWSWGELYARDLYGVRAIVEADTTIFDGNGRALRNGIAIMRASDLTAFNSRIDERGYYAEPDIRPRLSSVTLEAFFPEAEDYAENIDTVETARYLLTGSYYYILGYNLTLELIAKAYEVPDMTIFKMDTTGIEEKMKAYNALVPILYTKIRGTDYGDKELQAKKLQVLKDCFQPIDYEAITIPEENIAQAKGLMQDYAAFRPENIETLHNLLCVYPQPEDEEEGEY